MDTQYEKAMDYSTIAVDLASGKPLHHRTPEEHIAHSEELVQQINTLTRVEGKERLPELRLLIRDMNRYMGCYEVMGLYCGRNTRTLFCLAATAGAKCPEAIPYAVIIRDAVRKVLEIRRGTYEVPVGPDEDLRKL